MTSFSLFEPDHYRHNALFQDSEWLDNHGIKHDSETGYFLTNDSEPRLAVLPI